MAASLSLSLSLSISSLFSISFISSVLRSSAIEVFCNCANRTDMQKIAIFWKILCNIQSANRTFKLFFLFDYKHYKSQDFNSSLLKCLSKTLFTFLNIPYVLFTLWMRAEMVENQVFEIRNKEFRRLKRNSPFMTFFSVNGWTF